MNESNKINIPADALILFVGHSDDASVEARAIQELQPELQKELDALIEVMPSTPPPRFTKIKVWEWRYDAKPIKGGQEKAITPYLDSAHIAVFVFNTYVGAVTWDELCRFRSRKDCLVPLIALFPENPPSGELIRRPAGARGWADLLDKKEALTADWNKEGSQSLTPIKDYRDLDHLKNIILDQVKRVLGGLLKTNIQKQSKATEKPIEVKSEAALRIAYETTAKSRHPCVGANLGDLDWELVEGFREKESPSSRQESNREQVLAELGLFSPLSPIRCLHNAAVLCFCSHPHRVIPQAISNFIVGQPGDQRFNLEEVDGPLSRQVEKLVALTLERLDKISEFGQGGLRDDDTDIPSSVVREAISNAVAHRDYDLPGAVQVRVLDDHLEIQNPGAFPAGTSWEVFLKAGMVSRPADAAVALYLKRLLALEAIGRGFVVFRNYMGQEGPRSIIWEQPTTDTVLVRIRRYRTQGQWQEKLDFLLSVESVTDDPVQRLKLQRAIAEARVKLEELGARGHASVSIAPQISLVKLPQTGGTFLGREAELKLLDEAWADRGRTHVVVLVAAGGVGKTTLVKRWLDRLKSDGWPGAERVYGWSFYSQGTSEDRQASDDAFLDDALRWFGVEHDPTLSPWDKGRLLAKAIARSRTLLVLDGLEPLQHPPGPQGGALRAPGVQALLRTLAAAGQSGVCVITTREAVGDLAEYERTAHHPTGGVLAHDLGNLDEADGARLLYRLGVTRAGAAAIAEDDAELRAASREVRGHALALTLLGSYLKLAHGGDIRKRDLVKFEEADEQVEGGKAFRIMDAYVAWLKTSKHDRSLTAVLRLLGLFDRPADADCLAALRAEPAIAGLTEPLVGLSEAQWNITLQRLTECGLVYPAEENSAVDTHPLVREYFSEQLRVRQPEALRQGHRRLYEHLKASVPYLPEGLAGLQPLYQAVAHGCKAGLHQDVCAEVYRDRILRGTGHDGFYSTGKLGVFSADLGAVACFFEEPWRRLAPALSLAFQDWLLSVAAFNLRALGRLTESFEPMRAGLEHFVSKGDWLSACGVANNLSELELTLGHIAAALQDAEEAMIYAGRSGNTLWCVGTRTTLADVLHQRDRRTEAVECFREAEAIQVGAQPDYPLLYSLQGFRYCDLLLAEVERAAWRHCRSVPQPGASGGSHETRGIQSRWCEVEQRAMQTIQVAEIDNSLLDFALGHLTLGRAILYQTVLRTSDSARVFALTIARQELTAAVDSLLSAGAQEFIVRGLLTRAWLRFMEGDPEGTKADLDEAWRIAERGAMKLHMADIHLHRARLFRDRTALEAAARLIEETGYHRRDGELADAREALNHPQS